MNNLSVATNFLRCKLHIQHTVATFLPCLLQCLACLSGVLQRAGNEFHVQGMHYLVVRDRESRPLPLGSGAMSVGKDRAVRAASLSRAISGASEPTSADFAAPHKALLYPSELKHQCRPPAVKYDRCHFSPLIPSGCHLQSAAQSCQEAGATDLWFRLAAAG